jgi:hypothetical protein
VGIDPVNLHMGLADAAGLRWIDLDKIKDGLKT